MGRNPFANKPTQPPAPEKEEGADSPFPTFSTSETPVLSPDAGSIRSHIENIPAANFQPKKRTDKRVRAAVLFVRHLDDLQPRLEQTADKIGVPRDMLVRFLLEKGLERHYAGEAVLTPVLHQRLTLYPADPPRKRKRKGQTAKGVGFRGIPDETRQMLTHLAEQELYVPSWQVIRRLLEMGLVAWEEGKLAIHVHTVTTAENTLYPVPEDVT